MSEFAVGDRVQFVSDNEAVPVGTKGTVKGKAWGLYDVLFDHPRGSLPALRAWLCAADDLKKVDTMRSSPSQISREVQLEPLPKKVLHYMRTRGAISPLVAFSTYGTMRLAAAISELRKAGYDITTTMKIDEEGDKYASYSLNEQKAAA